MSVIDRQPMGDSKMKYKMIMHRTCNSGYFSQLQSMKRIRGMKNKKTVSLRKFIQYNLRHSIIVCPTEPVNPRYVATILGRRDHSVIINHHWVSTDVSSSVKVWGGAVAEFSCLTYVRLTAEDIKQQNGSLKIFFFKDIIDLLSAAEELYPKKEEATKIVIRGNKSFQDFHVYYLRERLKEFGNPKSILLRRGVTHGVIGIVEYPTQIQAYAARIAMHGMLFDCLGCLEVEVEVSESGKLFDDFVKEGFKAMLKSVDVS